MSTIPQNIAEKPLLDGKNIIFLDKVSNLCRMCLTSTADKLEIFGNIGNEVNIVNIVYLLFNCQINKDDSWPQNICVECFEKVKEYHGFFSTVKSTEATLERLLGPAYPPDVKVQLRETLENPLLVEEDDESHGETDFTDLTFMNVKIEESPEIVEEKPDPQITLLTTVEEPVEEFSEKSPAIKLRRNRRRKTEGPTKRELSDSLIRKYVELSCELCGMKFSLFDEVREHYALAHETKGYVTCCNLQFNNRHRLVEHMRYHVDPSSHQCQVCGKVFKFRNHLVEHSSTHIPPEQREFKCDQCPKSYTKLCRLRDHLKSHIPPGLRSLECKQCQKTFASTVVLRSHIRNVHERRQTTVCEVCAKVFLTKEAFLAHQINHMERKPPKVECAMCGKKFKQRTGLLRHMLKHKTPKGTTRCDQCGKETTSKRSLYNHVRTVHTTVRYPCHLCNKTFKRQLNLKEHIASHTGIRLYHCNFCDKSFNSNANKYTHQKKIHPAQWKEALRRKEEADAQ
ncbi:transcription factor grauzone [Sergentomyia squamirostris]